MFVPISCHRTSKPLGISCVSVMLMRWHKAAPRTLGWMLVTRKMDCMTQWGLWDSPTPRELRGLEVELLRYLPSSVLPGGTYNSWKCSAGCCFYKCQNVSCQRFPRSTGVFCGFRCFSHLAIPSGTLICPCHLKRHRELNITLQQKRSDSRSF